MFTHSASTLSATSTFFKLYTNLVALVVTDLVIYQVEVPFSIGVYSSINVYPSIIGYNGLAVTHPQIVFTLHYLTISMVKCPHIKCGYTIHETTKLCIKNPQEIRNYAMQTLYIWYI